MKLKKNSYNSSFKFYYILILIGLIALIVFKNSGVKTKNKEVKNKYSLNIPTYVPKAYNHINIIREDRNKVYGDSVLSIYINENLGAPFISYVYKDTLIGRQKTDYFYLHFFLKDTTKIKKRRNKVLLNMSFNALKPQQLEIDGKKYFVFKRILDDEFFDFKNIEYINTGRVDLSRKNRSYQIFNLKINPPKPYKRERSFEKFTLVISEKNYNTIKEKREKAINNNVLITNEDDLLNANISYKGSKRKKAKVRLKGDWIDHLNHIRKWSFRIIMENDKTIAGMRKFSIQDPKSRNYLWEWFFNKILKENNLIGLRYDFVDVDLFITKKKQVIDTIQVGIMAREESFDKILIENNKRREGIILAFDESLIWKDREKQFHLGLEKNARNKKLYDIQNAPIRIFNKNKVLSDPQLKKQFIIAKELLDGLRKGEMKISEVFDLDKLTTFVALSNLFGAEHGLIAHNLRVYYNPITNKLEPISFDSNSGQKLSHILNYPFSDGDDYYTEKLLEKLEMICQSDYVNEMIERNDEEINKLFLKLNNEFDFAMDLSILEYNSNFIKKKINPSNIIVSNLVEYKKNTMIIEVFNVSDYPVVINNLKHKDGKKMNKKRLNWVISPGENKDITINLKASFNNAFVSKKNKVGGFRYPKDISKVELTCNIVGVTHIRNEKILPYGTNPNNLESIEKHKQLFVENYTEFEFISEADNSIINFEKGKHIIDKNLIIPANYKVIIKEGTYLELQNNASIISFSPIICKGTKIEPITFYSSTNFGGGIFVSGASEESVLNYCYFIGLSNPSSNLWSLSGAVTFHETEVEIKNSTFEKINCEDGLNIIQSKFKISSSTFNDTQSDAFDGDFVEGSIIDCTFLNIGNDGIDVSGSTIFIEDVIFKNSSDKAISAGESSVVKGNNINVSDGEIGVVSKDLSSVILTNITISNTRLGFSAFQKKSEYGSGIIQVSNIKLVDNELNYLIEEGSKLYIDNNLIDNVSNRVLDKLYGKKYGKSSK